MIIRVLFSMLMIVGLLWGGSFVGAQTLDYPTKPIILQVPWPAGGSTDVGARIVASIAEKKMGQPIVVTNRVGAGSQIGLTETARQKPDGYFLGFASLPALNTIILDPERKALFRPKFPGFHHQPGHRSGDHLGQGRQSVQDLERPAR